MCSCLSSWALLYGAGHASSWKSIERVTLLCRLNQERQIMKQGAKDKLRRLVAPLLGITGGCAWASDFAEHLSPTPHWRNTEPE